MGKIKTEPDESITEGDTTIQTEELSYEEKVANCNVIAKPMASKKLAKRCYKLIKKAVKHKTYIRCGLKDVQTRIRKGETGLVIFAGDVTPIDIMCHLPGVCEDKNIPYVYTPSRKDLGAAMGVKRGCLTVLIRPNDDYADSFNELKEELTTLAVAL
ncbi:NHP2 ribonucleoprotein [Rhynchophorus ferrugineus]|uniref:NHP2 ribonucleoprotein n=1 Tax=Rhynchophorus ferrugineus TaxID=354439 RepID=UPI003FCCA330